MPFGPSPTVTGRARRVLHPNPPPAAYRVWSGVGAASPNAAAPARREDLTGLPPAWIGVGALNILHDEAVDYAKRLAAADVPCDLEVVPGAFHGFDAVAPKTALAQSFIASQLAFLCRALDSV